jgi:hypothetical protein
LPFRSRLCHLFASCDSTKVKWRATQLQRWARLTIVKN